MKDKVGIIGLGAMGGIYARHLLNAGFEVIGCDLVEARIAPLAKNGLKAVGTPKDAAEMADVLISSLPSLKALQDVIDGDNGVLRSKKSYLHCVCSCDGKNIGVQTTINPQQTPH